jgi:hypothetical protein
VLELSKQVVLQMKKYNNTKTIVAVSNKSAILVHVIAALMICSGAIYFIVASEDYSELSQSASPPSSPGSSTTTESKVDEEDTIATVNEIIFFTVVGVAYTAAGIWMLENKYYSKVPYIIAAIGSIALIAFYISTRTISIPSIGIQDDVGTMDILSKVMQAAIAGISIYIVRSSTIIWRSVTTTRAPSAASPSAAEILEYEVQKMQKRNKS